MRARVLAATASVVLLVSEVAAPDTKMVTVSFPRSCVSNPRWVRLGMGAVWMDDFFTATFGYLKELQANSSAVQTKLEQFVQWKYRSVVGRLGGSGSAEFSYRYGAQYTVAYAPTNSADFVSGSGPMTTCSMASFATSVAVFSFIARTRVSADSTVFGEPPTMAWISRMLSGFRERCKAFSTFRYAAG